MKELHLTKDDFRLDWFSGTGKGGQHRNKHQNCARITHIETGISAIGTSHKHRERNKEDAFRVLASRLVAHYDRPKDRRTDNDEVRIYHGVRNEVKDHASGLRMEYKDVVGKPNLGPMIEARKQKMELDE